MQGKYLLRRLENTVLQRLSDFPVVAILGPRQAGKSTLAHKIVEGITPSIYLDLEKPADLRKLTEPELFLRFNQDRLVCLDEIQRSPELFAVLRSVIDANPRNGQFLVLGSASRDLIKQSSETLAGRIAYIDFAPFDLSELSQSEGASDNLLTEFWLRGGFPRSFLAGRSELSITWRENFIRTFLERDIPQLGFQVPAETMRRFWQMCAHSHGQVLNSSKLGASLGVSHPTVRKYIDLLNQTFMVRVLTPFAINLKKRLVKSPKVYIRDSGILHALLEIDTFDDLIGHPLYGASWEGFALENIAALRPDWHASFYRTAAGAELDLILTRGQRKIGFEFKASSAPNLTRGLWEAVEDLQLDEVYVVTPGEELYPIKDNVQVSGLNYAVNRTLSL